MKLINVVWLQLRGQSVPVNCIIRKQKNMLFGQVKNKSIRFRREWRNMFNTEFTKHLWNRRKKKIKTISKSIGIMLLNCQINNNQQFNKNNNHNNNHNNKNKRKQLENEMKWILKDFFCFICYFKCYYLSK